MRKHSEEERMAEKNVLMGLKEMRGKEREQMGMRALVIVYSKDK